MVLLYAVPLLLFAGTVSTPCAELSQDLPLIIALCVAVVGLYGMVLLLSCFAFRRRMSTSARRRADGFRAGSAFLCCPRLLRRQVR